MNLEEDIYFQNQEEIKRFKSTINLFCDLLLKGKEPLKIIITKDNVTLGPTKEL